MSWIQAMIFDSIACEQYNVNATTVLWRKR